MNNVLLFDADGVMTLPEEFFSVIYARSHGLDPEPFEEFFRNDWSDIVTGKKDLKQHIKEHPDLWQWDGNAESLLKYWFDIEDVRNNELIELIHELRTKGSKCYLAAEQDKYRAEYMTNVMFPHVFDGYFYTADVGFKKNNPAFYEAVISLLKKDIPDLIVDEVTFFDDSQSKINAANSVGIKGILYTGINSVKKEYTINMNTSKQGTFLGIPYDFRTPTLARIKERYWNSADERILTPHVFGWGFAVNFYQLLRKIGLIEK